MSSKEKKEREKQRRDIVYSLPAFINQLLLLSNCGMVLSQAIEYIGTNYAALPESRKNYFTENIVKICEGKSETNESVIIAFHRFARLSGVKELTRVGNILMENRSKGTDLWLKLEEQSDSLWEERKRMVVTDIKLKESKMSFPLGILLVSLLIVTSAPAFMQMG